MNSIRISHRPRSHETKNELALSAGPGAGAGDVLTAAYRTPQLTPADILEIVASESEDPKEDILETIPGPGGFLVTGDWVYRFEGLHGEITDTFTEDNIPLFYLYVCRYPAVNPEPKGVRVEIGGGTNPPDAKYRIVFVPQGKYYRLYLYTSFGHDTECTIYYHGFKDGSSSAEIIEETAIPLPVSIPYEAALGEGVAGVPYRVYATEEYGSFELQVDDGIISDPRRPICFRYAIQATVTYPDGTTETCWSPWQAETVLNPESLSEHEAPDYMLGSKRLSTDSARVTMESYLGDLPPGSIVSYAALTDSESVEVYCRPDGEGPVYARTEVNTGALPDIISLPGRKWRYLEYTDEIIDRLRLQVVQRRLEVAFVVEKGDTDLASVSHSVHAPYGFGEATISVSSVELPEGDDDCLLGVYLINRPPGVDIQLIVGERAVTLPDGFLKVPWPEVVAAGSITVRLKEVYRPGGFARVYAVKVTRSAPPLVKLPEGHADREWHLRLSAGRTEQSAEDGSGLVYCTGLPVVRQAVEKVVPGEDGTAHLKHRPLAVCYDRSGGIVGIKPHNPGAQFTITACNPQEGTVQLRTLSGHYGDAVVRYWYISWEQEYKGFEDDGEFYLLDLNPRDGHTSTFTNNRAMPSGTLIGSDVYIYIKPSARVEYYRRERGETLTSLGYNRYRDYGIVLTLESRYTIDRGRGVRIHCYETGEEIPYGSGERYWLYLPGYENRILIVNPDTEADPIGRPLRRYLIDYWHQTTLPYAQENRERKILHSLSSLPDEDALLLCRVYMDYGLNPDDVELIDARRRGGGVKNELLPQAHSIEIQSRHYFDLGYWEGEPWQSHGSAVVFLPEETREKGLSEVEIQEAVDRHKAAGVLPVIRYWDAGEVYPGRIAHLTISLTDEESRGFVPPSHLTASVINEQEEGS